MVYLDHAATTSVRASALAALTGALSLLGNGSSVHAAGQAARAVLENARDSVAKSLGCHRSEVIFTSGGTEANNQAIKGIFWTRNRENPSCKLIITAATEHHALLDPVEWLEREQGAEVHWLKQNRSGVFDLAELESLLELRGSEVALISLMWGNNETGVLNDISAVTSLASRFGIPVHSDAVATVGHVPVDFAASGLAAMSVSGHKVGAPIGVGALVVARSLKPTSLLHGGGQERGLRSGTMNYPLAAAFASALAESVADLKNRAVRLSELREMLESGVRQVVPSVIFTTSDVERLPDNSHMLFEDVRGDTLLYTLDAAGIQVSTGSACQAGVVGPSHVLIGMGWSESAAGSCIRVTLGHDTQASDIEQFLQALPNAYSVAKLASSVGI